MAGVRTVRPVLALTSSRCSTGAEGRTSFVGDLGNGRDSQITVDPLEKKGFGLRRTVPNEHSKSGDIVTPVIVRRTTPAAGDRFTTRFVTGRFKVEKLRPMLTNSSLPDMESFTGIVIISPGLVARAIFNGSGEVHLSA
mmetsp:Transcript_150889/g.274638  ORF Transcript_150889/g.274638 Transcript_150889/m.274638 type:complete len:139 (-) Transcript_150889:509-925(-)